MGRGRMEWDLEIKLHLCRISLGFGEDIQFNRGWQNSQGDQQQDMFGRLVVPVAPFLTRSPIRTSFVALNVSPILSFRKAVTI